MTTASLTNVKARLSAYIDQAKTEGPVVITRNGKAVAVILAPVDDDDLENLLLTRSPQFQAMLEQSRHNIREGKGLAETEFWSEVEQEQAEAGP